MKVDSFGNVHLAQELSPKMRRKRSVKSSKERITVLFTCNVNGDYKVKSLVVVRAPTPPPYLHANMNNLHVYSSHNKRSWVTTLISPDWLDNHLVPDSRRNCQKITRTLKSYSAWIMRLVTLATLSTGILNSRWCSSRLTLHPDFHLLIKSY